MEITTIKYWIITGCKFVIVLLAFLFVLTKCGGCDNKIEVAKTDNTQYFAKMKSDSLLIIGFMEKQYQDSLKVMASKRSEDSIKVVADKNEKLYRGSAKKVRELIALGICDTVVVKVALNDCDSTIKSKNSLIAQKDSTNQKLTNENTTLKQTVVVQKDMVDASRTIIANQDKDYKELEKESKKALRRQKFKTIVAIIGGVVVEALTIFALK